MTIRSQSMVSTTLALAIVAALGLATAPVALVSSAPQAVTASRGLPARLSDGDFWKLVGDISEPGGYFRITDNYTSNEREVGQLFTMLRDRKIQGGVYLGVGPEQNFTYIAAIRPAMAFIVDIRRQAVMQHLMFKAIFELSKDRADFISLLFSRPRPSGLDAATPIQRIWDAYFAVAADAGAYQKNHGRIFEHLTKTHKFALTPEEESQLGTVYGAFYGYGPGITTRGGMSGRGGGGVTFADLTGWSYDNTSQPQSFLSSEDHFKVVKDLHDRNLIVPVSGDFGGTQAIRAIGAYLKKVGGQVSAFYVSNVEQYLFQDQKHQAFYENVATLPLAPTSVFIRPYSLRQRAYDGSAQSLCGIPGFLQSASAGRIFSNSDALACVK